VTTARCPACGASVAPGAPWCTLCYADLRPAPEPAPQPAPEPQPAMAGGPAYDALGVLPPAPLPAGTVLPPDPHLDAPVLRSADVRLAEPSWPCRSCGIRVAMSEDNCPKCHAPFLEPEDTVDLTLPVVGNVRRLDTKMRTILGFVGAFGMTLVLVVVAFVLGAIL
jgi:hypothetical protein